MDLGINLATSTDSWKIVKRAEELGYARVWFYDTHMLNADVFVGMASAAMVTSKIRLGTGVLIPSNRIAPVAASALASINGLAPGRVDFGISTGNTARTTMGLGAVKQADMQEYIRIVQALLRGETVEWDFEGKHRKIRLLGLTSGRILRSGGTEGRSDAAAGELFAGGIRWQEKADAARQIFGRDGASGAVGAAG